MTDYVANADRQLHGDPGPRHWMARPAPRGRLTPEGHELTIDRGPDAPTTYRAEIAGTSYAKDDDASCSAEPSAEGESLADLYDPAAQLPLLVGADEAGIETIDGTPAHHYTFDERAMVLANPPQASGDVWVADTGGYVLRYLLTVDAGPEYFGEDTAGTRTLEYVVVTRTRRSGPTFQLTARSRSTCRCSPTPPTSSTSRASFRSGAT